MSRLPKSKFVMLGIRIACALVFLGIVSWDFRRYGLNVAIQAVVAGMLGLLISLSNWQGRKLAKQNMQKYGLEPDRDEGPASL